jgi:hypothetical protein
MTQLTVDLDEENNFYILSGDVSAALTNVSVKQFFLNFLHASIEGDVIKVPFEKQEKEIILKKIHKLLERYSFSETHSKYMQEVMNEYYCEEENFKLFSKKAETIKENNCEKEDFENFSHSVAKNLSKRKLYPLQLLSAYHLAFSQNSCNFSVPGAGKTSIVYGAYSYLKI